MWPCQFDERGCGDSPHSAPIRKDVNGVGVAGAVDVWRGGTNFTAGATAPAHLRTEADMAGIEPASAVAGLEAVRRRIARAAHDAGRDPASVTLVAVSKTFGAEAILPVLAAGQRVF